MATKRANKKIAVTVPLLPSMHETMTAFARSRGLSLAAFYRQAGVNEKERCERQQQAA